VPEGVGGPPAVWRPALGVLLWVCQAEACGAIQGGAAPPTFSAPPSRPPVPPRPDSCPTGAPASWSTSPRTTGRKRAPAAAAEGAGSAAGLLAASPRRPRRRGADHKAGRGADHKARACVSRPFLSPIQHAARALWVTRARARSRRLVAARPPRPPPSLHPSRFACGAHPAAAEAVQATPLLQPCKTIFVLARGGRYDGAHHAVPTLGKQLRGVSQKRRSRQRVTVRHCRHAPHTQPVTPRC
jgi:hypothetical protein